MRKRLSRFLFLPIRFRTAQKHTGQSHAISPHFIFRAVGVRAPQPLDDLIPALRLGGNLHDRAVCLKHRCPEPDLLLGWVFCAKAGHTTSPGTPAVWRIRWASASDDVLRLGFVDHRRVFVVPCHQGRRLFLCGLHIGAGGHGVDCVAVGGIEREADLLVDAITLGTIFLLSSNQGPWMA